ncbi:MAG: DUF1566 domain-containing protein [Desulfobulbaceae bacterium]|nr:DUF1566 domain-containing protein [Desulfobulbaceae bacterium]
MNRATILGIGIMFSITCSGVFSMAKEKVVIVPLGGARGNAKKSDVLTGKTFSNSSSRGITGTRPPAPVARTGAVRSDHAGDDASYAAMYGQSSPGRFARIEEFGRGKYDSLTGLYWELSPPSTMYSWTMAIDRCEDKVTGGFYSAEYSDWRLPNVQELLSIVDRGQSNPALPPIAGFSLPANSDPFWTSTPFASTSGGASTNAWAIDLGTGTVSTLPKTGEHYTLCVRGGPTGTP